MIRVSSIWQQAMLQSDIKINEPSRRGVASSKCTYCTHGLLQHDMVPISPPTADKEIGPHFHRWPILSAIFVTLNMKGEIERAVLHQQRCKHDISPHVRTMFHKYIVTATASLSSFVRLQRCARVKWLIAYLFRTGVHLQNIHVHIL